jgi:hypothetical protein
VSSERSLPGMNNCQYVAKRAMRARLHRGMAANNDIPMAPVWGRIPRAWVLEALLLAGLGLLLLTAFLPGQNPDTGWRLRMQQAVVVERLVGLGFDRAQVHSTVHSLTPRQVEDVSRHVGTPYAVSGFLTVLCGGLLLGLLATLLVIWV